MAKMPSAATRATATAAVSATAFAYAVGMEVTFKGYAEPLAEGEAALFAPGEACKITAIDTSSEPNSMTIVSLDGAKSDTAFGDEVNPPVAKKATAKAKAAPAPAAPAAAVKVAAPAKPAKASKTPNLAGAVAGKAAKPAKAEKAPKAAKAPVVAQPKAEPVPVEIVNTASVEALMQGDALSAAKDLINQSEETFFTLGGVLTHIHYERTYEALGGDYAGKQGWQLYVEKELGVGYRKAMHLIDIYQSFTALEIDEKRLSEVGWSKAKELTRALTADNADELLEFAEQHSKEEVIDYVKTTYPLARDGQGSAQPSERVKKVSYKFALTDTEAEVANAALEAAKTRGETTDLSQAAYLIFSEWSQLVGAVEVTLEEAIEQINTKYGVTLGTIEE
jgi:hypothetical protein